MTVENCKAGAVCGVAFRTRALLVSVEIERAGPKLRSRQKKAP